LPPLHAQQTGSANRLGGRLDDAAIWTDALDTAHARSLYTVPTDLGLAYDVADMTDLWGIHALGPGGSGLVDEPFWTFTTDLPGSPNPGDAYEHESLFYLVLGDVTGVQTVAEPSPFLLSAFVGWRRRKR